MIEETTNQFIEIQNTQAHFFFFFFFCVCLGSVSAFLVFIHLTVPDTFELCLTKDISLREISARARDSRRKKKKKLQSNRPEFVGSNDCNAPTSQFRLLLINQPEQLVK